MALHTLDQFIGMQYHATFSYLSEISDVCTALSTAVLKLMCTQLRQKLMLYTALSKIDVYINVKLM